MGYFRPLSQTKFINDANLVSYWKLDGNSNDSKGSNNGTDTSMSYSAGKFDNAGVFASSTAKIDVGNSSTLNVTTGDMTWILWINPSSLTNYKTMFRRGTSNTDGYYFYFYNSKVSFTSNQSGASQNVYSLTNITTGVWQQLTIVKSGTTISHYLNGKFDGSGAITNPTTSTQNLIIGQYDNTTYYSGAIDDTAIFSRALSAGEVAELYQSMTLGEYLPNSSTKLLLHLNGSSADSSGNNNNGTDTDITYSQANGKFGQGAGFNGTSSKILMPQTTSLKFGSGNRTIGWWQKATKMHFGNRNGQNVPFWEVDTHTPNNIHFFSIVNSFVYPGNATDLSWATTISSTEWNHIMVTLSGTSITAYKNGQSLGSKTWTVPGTTDNSVTNFEVGTFQQGQGPTEYDYGEGSLDEVKIEAEAWSASEVKKYYTYAKGRFGII